MRLSFVLLVALATALACLTLACGGEPDGRAPTPVTLALDFTPNAAHAGIYAAVRERADTRRGVRLRVRAPSSSADGLKLLTLGRADLAVVDIHDLGLARERGSDLVGVGALVQRPLAAVIAGRGVRRPRDLEGRRVGVTGLPSDEAVLRAVVEDDGGRIERVSALTIGFGSVPALAARRVAAATAFWNAEGVALRERGVPTREFRVDDHGAPRYPELVLVTRRSTLRRRRDLVRRTLAALAAGTREVQADPRAAERDVIRASGGDPALVRAQLRAVLPALRPPLRLDPAALSEWAEWDERFGILRERPDVRRAFDVDLIR